MKMLTGWGKHYIWNMLFVVMVVLLIVGVGILFAVHVVLGMVMILSAFAVMCIAVAVEEKEAVGGAKQ